MSIYFDKLHQASPMLHRQRFIASLHLPTHMQPPMCLQYIIMASAATSSDTYRHLSLPFYQHAKAYANCDDIEVSCPSLAIRVQRVLNRLRITVLPWLMSNVGI